MMPINNDAISRSELIKQIRLMASRTSLGEIRPDDISGIEVCGLILNAPTLDVAPVVHAHWIKTFGSDGFVSTLRCSKCDNAENSTYIPGNFCWFCGAKMDGDSE